MSVRQTSPRWEWIILSGNNIRFSPPYCILTFSTMHYKHGLHRQPNVQLPHGGGGLGGLGG